MNEEQMKQVFHRIGKNKVMDTVDIWPELSNNLSIQPNNNSIKFMNSTNRLKWGLLTVVAVFLLTSVAYAFNSQLRALLNQDPVFDTAKTNELGHIFNQTQSHEGVDVTLEWAYADENRVSVAYTISKDDAEQYHLVENNLLDADGTQIPPFVGMVATENDAPSDGYIFSYDLSSYHNQTNMLDLQLVLILKSDQTNQLLEPFVFEFSIPVEIARSAKLNQRIVTQNIPITLKDVTITLTEVTSVICFDDPALEYTGWLPISQIDVRSGNHLLTATVGSQSNRLENGCVSNRYFPSLYEAQGTWTLTVTELVGFSEGKPLDENAPAVIECSDTNRSEYCREQIRIEGPWVFEFSLDE